MLTVVFKTDEQTLSTAGVYEEGGGDGRHRILPLYAKKNSNN